MKTFILLSACIALSSSAAFASEEKITFTSTRDGNSEIYVMNTDGSGQTNLTQTPSAQEDSPRWRRDGSKIVYTRPDGIWTMNGDGSNQATIRAGANYRQPDYDQHGQNIAFAELDNADYDVFVTPLDGTAKTRITSNPLGDYHPRWNPDNSKIAFHTFNYFTDAYLPDIYVMNADGSAQTRITTTGGNLNADWSPDGQKLVFQSRRDCNYEIYVINADGSGETRLTDNSADDTFPTFSPDGSKIAFVSARDGNEEIYVMDADGSNPVRLTDNPGADSAPSWVLRPSAELSVEDAAVSEGNSGITELRFTAKLSQASSETITVQYKTANGTAAAPVDYVAVETGLLTFEPGETSKTLIIQVQGDTVAESDETFSIMLSNAINAFVNDESALGTILDDDAPYAPANAHLSPNNMTSDPGEERIFQTQHTDTNGHSDIEFVMVEVGSGSNILRGYYHKVKNKLYLLNDAGTAYSGGFALGSNNVISNSRGSLNCQNTTVSATGNTLTVNWSLTPTQAMAGMTHDVKLLTRDLTQLKDDWEKFGSWKVVLINQPPVNVNLLPNITTSAMEVEQLLETQHSDANGHSNIEYVMIEIGSGNYAVRGYYNKVKNRLYLLNDSNTSFMGGFAPGSDNIISNSRGSLHCKNTFVVAEGNNLKIGWSLSLHQAIGFLNHPVQLLIRDIHLASAGWKRFGSWKLTASPPRDEQKLIVTDGNSLTDGRYSTYPAQLLIKLGLEWTLRNFGVTGQSTPMMLNDAATQIDPLYRPDRGDVLVAWEITNDLNKGTAWEEAYQNYKTYCEQRRSAGWKVIAVSVLPRTQPNLSANFDAGRIEINEDMRQNWMLFADGFADVAADARIGDAGDELDTLYYTDGIHMTPAGYDIVAEIVAAAVTATTAPEQN